MSTDLRLFDGHTTLAEALKTASEMHELAIERAEEADDTAATLLSKGAAIVEMLVSELQRPPKTPRMCADSVDGNHVLKQDGPFGVVYCDACGMNKGHRTDG